MHWIPLLPSLVLLPQPHLGFQLLSGLLQRRGKGPSWCCPSWGGNPSCLRRGEGPTSRCSPCGEGPSCHYRRECPICLAPLWGGSPLTFASDGRFQRGIFRTGGSTSTCPLAVVGSQATPIGEQVTEAGSNRRP